jgi:hypothetical protein
MPTRFECGHGPELACACACAGAGASGCGRCRKRRRRVMIIPTVDDPATWAKDLVPQLKDQRNALPK